MEVLKNIDLFFQNFSKVLNEDTKVILDDKNNLPLKNKSFNMLNFIIFDYFIYRIYVR